jgi:hypothetical protein
MISSHTPFVSSQRIQCHTIRHFIPELTRAACIRNDEDTTRNEDPTQNFGVEINICRDVR